MSCQKAGEKAADKAAHVSSKAKKGKGKGVFLSPEGTV